MRKKWIRNGTIVTPEEVFKGNLLIEEGTIREITPFHQTPFVEKSGSGEQECEVYDASGCYVMPGLVDLHGDLIEKAIQPRKRVLFPTAFALRAIQTQLLSSGITSIFHGISFTEEDGLRSNEKGCEIAEEIIRLRNSSDALLRHYLHVRYELINSQGLSKIIAMMEKGWVSLLSVMDHTPQYGKYQTLDEYKYYVEKSHNLSGAELEQFIEEKRAKREAVDPTLVEHLIRMAIKYRIPLASHDDDTPQKLDKLKKWGVSISEFPLNEETASYARQMGMHVVVGGPNILRGYSHENKLSAREAVKREWADVICSDYYPFSLLASVFVLADEGVELPQAVALTSLNPASAVGMDRELGSLEVGKQADLLIVQSVQGAQMPLVKRVMVAGEWRLSLQ